MSQVAGPAPSTAEVLAPKWIQFVEIPAPREQVTQRWEVRTKDGKGTLGLVKWYGSWRRYGFFPYAGTVYEMQCLRDIASFCEEETRKRRTA